MKLQVPIMNTHTEASRISHQPPPKKTCTHRVAGVVAIPPVFLTAFPLLLQMTLGIELLRASGGGLALVDDAFPDHCHVNRLACLGDVITGVGPRTSGLELVPGTSRIQEMGLKSYYRI